MAEKPHLDLAGFAEAIVSSAEASNAHIPANLFQVLKDTLGDDLKIQSPYSLKILCKKIIETLDGSDLLAGNYGDFFSKVRKRVRLEVAMQVGLEDYFKEKIPEIDMSPREAIRNFIRSLKARKPWTRADFEKYVVAKDKAQTPMKGAIIMGRISAQIGEISEEVMMKLIGDGFEKQLENHPYTHRAPDIGDDYDMARYFAEFLLSMPKEKTWNPQMLIEWTASDGTKGHAIYERFRSRYGGLNLDSIRALLRARSKAALARNPLEKRECFIRTEDEANKYLSEFLSTLEPGEKWNMEDLKRWESSDGASGIALETWIRRHYKKSASKAVLKLAGRERLKRNPFKFESKKLRSATNVGEALIDFLLFLPPGSTWSVTTLTSYAEDGKPSGAAIKSWLDRNTEAARVCPESLLQVLGEYGGVLLQAHPFVPHHSVQITNRRDARALMEAYLKSLPQGEAWTTKDLRKAKVTLGDQVVSGEKVAAWIGRNIGDENDPENVKKLLAGDPNGLLQSHPKISSPGPDSAPGV